MISKTPGSSARARYKGDLLAFRRSDKPGAQQQRILLDAVPGKPSRFRSADRADGWVLYRWETEFGTVVLAYPVRDGLGMIMPGTALLDRLAPDAAALAVVESDYNIPHGPSLEAVDAASRETYGTTWPRLARLLGSPAPYWHATVRDPELMTAWKPGTRTLEVPAVVVPDPGPLLRLAAQEPDGSHAAVAALDTVRRTVWSAAQDCRNQMAQYVDTSEDIASIAVAARPLVPPQPPTVAEEILRDGWRSILTRTDTLAAECARLGKVLGATQYFTGSCNVTVDLASCEQARRWAARLKPSPRTALATYLGDDREQDILVDPVTDMPAARTGEQTIETVAPQRLPAHSPLAALTIGRGSVWVTTQDDTVFLAPQLGGNYTYGYAGGGPMALARLIGLLLDDITQTAPESGGHRPAAGLRRAVQEDWKERPAPFTLTRTELEALRDG